MTLPQVTVPLAQFVTIWGFLAVNILSPGPNVLNTIALAMGSGRRAGMGSASGVGLGIGVWCLGMTLGMATLFQALPFMQTALTVLAVGLLALFASRYLRAALHGWRHAPGTVPRGKGGLTFWQGFRRALGIAALNPKALSSWLAILALFPLERAGPADIALLCAGACALSFVIHGGYTLIFSTPPAARTYLRFGPLISAAAGLIFAGFALRLMIGLFGPA